MILLIDVGNTRVKWALYQDGNQREAGALDHADIARLATIWVNFDIRAAYGASVVHSNLRDLVGAQAPCPVEWVKVQAAAAGVVNHYDDPAQMGVDRWLSVLAARRMASGDVVVAGAGTALTVECLTAEGDYLGGLIMPGYRLMLSSLAGNTARLDQPAGDWSAFPTCTEDALASGALEAMVGAIERARARLAARTGRGLAPVLLTGGDAGRIFPLLASPCRIVDNLVLNGLLEVADKT